MAKHVSCLCNLWQVANDMGAGIVDAQFHTVFNSLFEEEWDNVVPVLHTFKTSVEIISFVTMHAERLNRNGTSSTSNPTPQALPANTNFDACRAARKNLVCSNVQCSAPGKKGHVITDCYWPGGGKEGQWPAWWKGKKPAATLAANGVETFAFSVWTIPEAVVKIYDTDGIQAVQFHGEEVLASPESFMAWEEAAEATVPSMLPNSNFSIQSETSSFEILNVIVLSSASSDFELVSDLSVVSDDTNDDLPDLQPFSDVSGDCDDVGNLADFIAPLHRDTGFILSHDGCFPELNATACTERLLHYAQPYPRDEEIQVEWRFLIYSTSDTEHVILDNQMGEDVFIRTELLQDPSFDLVQWYTHHRISAQGYPDEILAFMADTLEPYKYLVVGDSTATDHCFWKRKDFSEYYLAASNAMGF
ncbi:hypothetical protein B0H10DRAFT_2210677 [Mycena sp. CBHHK59/15]|nr:hypothetical protein B0H10DRAFT_2210677 [Mycena sp. CBHHK59/15]